MNKKPDKKLSPKPPQDVEDDIDGISRHRIPPAIAYYPN